MVNLLIIFSINRWIVWYIKCQKIAQGGVFKCLVLSVQNPKDIQFTIIAATENKQIFTFEAVNFGQKKEEKKKTNDQWIINSCSFNLWWLANYFSSRSIDQQKMCKAYNMKTSSWDLRNCDGHFSLFPDYSLFLTKRFTDQWSDSVLLLKGGLPSRYSVLSPISHHCRHISITLTCAAYLCVSAEPSEWTEARIRGTAGQIPLGWSCPRVWCVRWRREGPL